MRVTYRNLRLVYIRRDQRQYDKIPMRQARKAIFMVSDPIYVLPVSEVFHFLGDFTPWSILSRGRRTTLIIRQQPAFRAATASRPGVNYPGFHRPPMALLLWAAVAS